MSRRLVNRDLGLFKKYLTRIKQLNLGEGWQALTWANTTEFLKVFVERFGVWNTDETIYFTVKNSTRELAEFNLYINALKLGIREPVRVYFLNGNRPSFEMGIQDEFLIPMALKGSEVEMIQLIRPRDAWKVEQRQFNEALSSAIRAGVNQKKMVPGFF